jgi:hypothetical protein
LRQLQALPNNLAADVAICASDNQLHCRTI